MTERLQGSPDLGKLKSEKSKELLEKYQRQREQYYRTKNKGDRITEEQRRTIDAEMDAKINQLSQQENQKKGEAMAEISSIQSGLDAINTSNVENLSIPNFEFNNAIGFGSIQAIREQAQLYVSFNEGIHKKAEAISTLYNQFMQVVNRFNKEREDDTRWSGDSDYEKYVDTINQRIETYKKLFADAEAELTRAIEKSDRAGERLNNAPDDLRNKEGTNQEGTEGQFKEQEERHTGEMQAYTLHGQRLQESSQRLQQGQTFLNNYSDQLVQVTDALTVQKNQVDNTLLDWDNKRRDFQNTMNIVCFASNVTPFSDDELRSLVADPEGFIKRIEPQERQQAALNLYNQYGQKLAEYVQIIDRYQVGVDQRNQLSQGITEVQNRQAQVTQSQQDITDQQGVVNDEITENNNRIQNVRQLMVENQEQHEQSLEYYGQNMDAIDKLDYEMSSIILDNDLSNGGILETIASQRKSFVGLKVSAKGGWERAYDSTIGMVGKGLRYLVIEPIKEVLLFLPNLVQKFGEDHPSIGENWLFKVLNFPFQLQAGTVEGALNLVEGLVEMCEQPMATLNGLGQLIGRDSQTGEWSFGTAGDAWLNFAKAMIAYDEWGEGNDGRALGHGAANIASLFIPAAGEVSAAANTAKVARLLGGVSKTKAALIGVTDFGIRTGTKFTKGVKGTFNSLRNIPKTVKKGFGYVDDVAEGAVKKGKTIANDVREAGGVTKYVKRGLESTRDAYHNAGGIRGLGRQSLELGTGYTNVRGVTRVINGEPLFGKKFPSLKKLPKKRLQMEERLQKLRGKNGVGGELDSMYEKVSKYVDKNGDLLEGVKGTEIPMRDWGKIYDYQSALQEVRSLEATIAKYKHVETSLVDEAGNTTKLGKFIQENEKFGKAMEEMLENPSKAKDILAKFKKKNPKVDMSALEDVEIFRDGGKIYRIKNGELVEGEGVIKPTKKTYTAEDYGLKPEIYDELVEQLYLEPGTAEFNAEAVARGGKIPARLEGEIVKPKIPTAEDYGLKPEIYDELVEQLYLKPGTAEFNAEAVARGGKIPARLEGEVVNTNLETLENLLNENKILENGVYKYKDGTIKQLRTELERCSTEELENIAKTTTNPEIQNQAFQILGKREVESLKMNSTGEINPNNFEVGDIIEFNDKHVPEIKIKTKLVEDGKVYYDLEVSGGTTYRHVPAEDFKIPVNSSEGVYPHNLKFAKGIKRGEVRVGLEEGRIVEEGAGAVKYLKDANGHILPENYTKMTPDELLAEYKRLKAREDEGGRIETYRTEEGTILSKRVNDASVQKAQIREILKEKYKLDRNGNPIKSEPGTTEIKPNVRIGEGGEYTLDARGHILPENYTKMSPDELLAEYKKLTAYENEGGTIREIKSADGSTVKLNSHNKSLEKRQIEEVLKEQYGLDTNGTPLRIPEGTRVTEGVEAEIPQRTVQDIFDDLSLQKITPKEARRELAKALHPDLLGDDASILLRDALEDYNKIVSGEHPEFERSRDWSKISGESAWKPRVTEGTRVPEGAAIPKRPKLNPARNDRFSKETLDLFDDGDIIELSYKGGKGPISERRVKENGGYRKLKENGGKYESTETVVTEEEMVTKMRDAITIDPIKWSPKGATEGTRVVPERPSPTVIELEYKGGKKIISERRVKEEGGYRKFEGEGGKYKRTETVLTENEMAIRIKEVKSGGGTGIEVGKETDIFKWAESRATEIKKKPVELRIINKSEVKPNALHEGDRVTWDGQEMEITKRIELDGGKVSYEFKYTEGSTTKTVEMTAEELAGDWNNVNKIMRPQIQIRGMNDYFKENVNTCKGKKLYIEGNEYTAAIDENGALHLKYSGKHKYPIKYEIGEDGKLKQVKNEALQNDITVSSFDQLKTKWNASPIDDGRSVSGTLRNNARELTLDEAKNVEFWNKLWKEEKERAIASNERPAIENPLKPEEVKKTWAEEVAESPVVRNYSPEGYKSPIDTFDELLNSPEGVTIEGVNYKWDFSEITNPPKHVHNPNWRPNIKLIVTDRNGVPQTFKTKYQPGRELKPGEVIQPTKVLPGPKVEWEMTADGKRYPKKVEELPSNAEDIIKKYYEARQKYVDEYNRSLPVRQGEPGVPATVERPGVPATVERPGVPATIERPGVPATVERPGVPATIERPVPTAPEIKPPLIPNVPLWVSGAVFAILANKNHEEPVHIDVPGTTGFEWTPQDQKEVSEFQEFLSKNPSGTEIKDFVRKNKDAFKKLILVKDGEKGGANVNFDLLNSLIEQGKFNGLDGNIQEQLKNNIIRYIGLGEVLEEGTTFTVTSVDGKIRKGKIVNNRAVDEKGKYIPIFQGDHVESDALGFLDPIYPYSEPRVDRIDPDAELDAALEGIDG